MTEFAWLWCFWGCLAFLLPALISIWLETALLRHRYPVITAEALPAFRKYSRRGNTWWGALLAVSVAVALMGCLITAGMVGMIAGEFLFWSWFMIGAIFLLLFYLALRLSLTAAAIWSTPCAGKEICRVQMKIARDAVSFRQTAWKPAEEIPAARDEIPAVRLMPAEEQRGDFIRLAGCFFHAGAVKFYLVCLLINLFTCSAIIMTAAGEYGQYRSAGIPGVVSRLRLPGDSFRESFHARPGAWKPGDHTLLSYVFHENPDGRVNFYRRWQESDGTIRSMSVRSRREGGKNVFAGICYFRNDKPHGMVRSWDENGALTEHGIYDNGTLVKDLMAPKD